MAKKKKIVLTLTPAQEKELKAINAKYAESTRLLDEAEAMRDKIGDVEDKGYELSNEAEDDSYELVAALEEASKKAATAEAEKLNKANKDPKVEYMASAVGMAKLVTDNEVFFVNTFKATKSVKYDRAAELAKELRTLGYTVTKPKAK